MGESAEVSPPPPTPKWLGITSGLRSAERVPRSKKEQGCGCDQALVLNIARDWSAVVGEAAVLVAGITILVFGYGFGGFFCLVSYQLLAGHWGKVHHTGLDVMPELVACDP